VAEGLKRIVADQLQLAIWELSADQGPTDHAVHEARKCLKKLRSAMRLFQNILGKEYEQGNVALRDAGRKLSPLRDSQALIEMFDELNDKYRDDLGDRSLVSIRDGLVKRKKSLAREFQQKRTRGAVLKSLRTFARRADKWNVNEAGLVALSKGFARTIRWNQQACQTAYAESRSESFHEWRKRAKDLRYHLNLVSKAWPEVLDGYEAAAKDLESKLGDDHNLVVMRDTILEKPDTFGKEEDITAFLKVVYDHQKNFGPTAESSPIASIPKTKVWRRRLELCWRAGSQLTGCLSLGGRSSTVNSVLTVVSPEGATPNTGNCRAGSSSQNRPNPQFTDRLRQRRKRHRLTTASADTIAGPAASALYRSITASYEAGAYRSGLTIVKERLRSLSPVAFAAIRRPSPVVPSPGKVERFDREPR
jgi:CHAD domain-containing protein